MLWILFYTVLLSTTILYIGLGISIFRPESRIWPPPSKYSWQYWISWVFIAIPSIGVPLLGILDWNSLNCISYWVRFPVSSILLIISSVIIMWGLRTLSLHQSLGLEGSLVTHGPYRYSRNPQYVGLIIFYSAVILLTDSLLALIAGLFFIPVYALTPLSEEPWLAEKFGTDYLDYKKRVPRFIGRRRGQEDKNSGEKKDI